MVALGVEACWEVDLTTGTLSAGSWMRLWGEVSMCDTPPTLIIVHFDMVQHFV
jgi:hypothetical protein